MLQVSKHMDLRILLSLRLLRLQSANFLITVYEIINNPLFIYNQEGPFAQVIFEGDRAFIGNQGFNYFRRRNPSGRHAF